MVGNLVNSFSRYVEAMNHPFVRCFRTREVVKESHQLKPGETRLELVRFAKNFPNEQPIQNGTWHHSIGTDPSLAESYECMFS